MRKTCGIISPFFNHTSEAKIARNLIDSLASMNANFSVDDISESFEFLPKNKERYFSKLVSKNTDSVNGRRIVFNSVLSSISLCSYDNFIPYFSIKANNLPAYYYKILNNKEKILVYNNFTKKVICDSGISENKVIIVPPTINSRIIKSANKFKINGKRKFSFLSVVNLRKDSNWLSVVKSFYDSFSSDDDICLILKANDSNYSKYNKLNIAREIDAEKKRHNSDVPPVILISSPLTDQEMAGLYESCDFFVRISGVNSGLSFIEAFASGLICIGPSDGGCREILDRNTGFMIRKDKEKRIYSKDEFNGTTYNIYDGFHLSEIMQWVVNNFDNLKEKTAKERKIILSQFDQNIVGQKFLKSLR